MMPDKTFEQLKTIDYFFYYGQSSLEEETKHDIIIGLLQPKRTMFYDRAHGAGINEYEQYPNSVILQLGIRYDIASWISKRNTEVSNGADGTRDRRVAISQATINVTANKGNIDVSVLYIPFANYMKPQTITVPAGIGANR